MSRDNKPAPDGTVLRDLTGDECLEAQGLWREVFSEDSPVFTAYYFARKARQNRGLVLKGPDGIRSMLYLTPEKMSVLGRPVDSVYLVGVATKEKYRRRGYMAFLLKEALGLLYREGIPFLFLMPASPAIYRPFDFTYIYEKPVWDPARLKKEKLRIMGEPDAKRLSAFASSFLQTHKGVYVLHDTAYYIQQAAELAAQNGCIYGYEENGKLKGICLYTCEDHSPQIQEVLAEEETEKRFIQRTGAHQPVIMARIVHARQMLSCLHLREGEAFALSLQDPLLLENNGVFLCRPGRSETQVTFQNETPEHREGMRPALWHADGEDFPLFYADIASLTAALFGSKRAAEKIGFPIRPLAPVWINEIV